MGAVIGMLAVLFAVYAIAHAVPFGGESSNTLPAPETDGLPASSKNVVCAADRSSNSVKAGCAHLASGLPASSQSDPMPCGVEIGEPG